MNDPRSPGDPARTDVFLAEAVPDDHDMPKLAPPEGLSPAEFHKQLADPVVLRKEDPYEQAEADERRLTFGMGELMLLVTCSAIGAAGVGWMPPSLFAATAGGMAFALVILSAVVWPQNRRLRFICSAFVVIYIVAAIVTLAQSLMGS